MNREILFKGKRVSNGEWVEGYIVKRPTGEWQIERRCDNPPDGDPMWKKVLITYEVKPDTICQYTGLTDKNGKKIWENDIVEFEDTGEEGYEYKEGFDFQNRAKVEFAEARWSLTDFISTNSSVVDEMYNHAEFMDFWQYCEVIGNIFDNKELLEGGE